MKNGINSFFLVFVFSFFVAAYLPTFSFAQDDYGNCGMVASTQTGMSFSHIGGRYITSQGVLTSFVLFVRFHDDNEASSSWPNPSVLPGWAQNILNPNYSASGDYTTNSLTHYLYENSYGKLHVIGDVYYVTLPHDEAYYYSLGGTANAARSAIQQDAFNQFQTLLANLEEDLTKYDNWKRTSDFNHVYTGPGSGESKDNIVDMCWVILRNLHDGNYSGYSLGQDIALLFASKTIGGITIQSGWPGDFGTGSGISLFSYSWLGHLRGNDPVIKMRLSELDNDGYHFTIIGTMVHELSHWFFYSGHFGQPNNSAMVSSNYLRSSSHMATYCASNSGPFGNFLGYEKIRLGWIAPSEIQEVTSSTTSTHLPDMETTTSGTKIIKIPLDADQSIYLENRSWNSSYEARYSPLNSGKPLKPGVLAYLITREDDYLYQTPIQQICANGKWTWDIVAGGLTGLIADNDDVIIKSTPNANTGYDEREDIHIAGQGSKTWWALYYPNAELYGSYYGRWYKGTNYINDTSGVGDYRGNVNQIFDLGDVISPCSNGATHKWNETTGSFAPTTIGIELTGFNSSTSDYTLSVVTSDPDQLSPSKPQYFHLASPSGCVQLAWAASSEGDFASYEVSRKVGTSQWQVIGNPTTNSFTDYDYGISQTGSTLYYRVRTKDTQNKYSLYSDLVSVRAMNLEKRSDALALPLKNALAQSFPNPFNPSTTISYQVTDLIHVSLKIFNTVGQEVATLVEGEKEPGYYTVDWNAATAPSGIYFYRIVAGKFSATKKMLLMK